MVNYGCFHAAKRLAYALNLFSRWSELLNFLNTFDGFTIGEFVSIEKVLTCGILIIWTTQLTINFVLFNVHLTVILFWLTFAALGLKMTHVWYLDSTLRVIGVKWIHTFSIFTKTLVLWLIHAYKRSSRSEVKMFTYNEFLAYSQIVHYILGFHPLNFYWVLDKHAVFFFILDCVHGKKLIIQLFKSKKI